MMNYVEVQSGLQVIMSVWVGDTTCLLCWKEIQLYTDQTTFLDSFIFILEFQLYEHEENLPFLAT